MSDLISIALATYNGSKYITEMLDSIAQQTHSHFMVNICDDGSVDNTIDIIKEHKLFDAGKIIIHDTDGGNGALKISNEPLTIVQMVILHYVTRMTIGCPKVRNPP
jgi:glycosyltransferase involved in cell wall biosynthesis